MTKMTENNVGYLSFSVTRHDNSVVWLTWAL